MKESEIDALLGLLVIATVTIALFALPWVMEVFTANIRWAQEWGAQL